MAQQYDKSSTARCPGMHSAQHDQTGGIATSCTERQYCQLQLLCLLHTGDSTCQQSVNATTRAEASGNTQSLCMLAGPTLRFHTDLVVAVTGAAFQATLDGKPVPLWQSFKAVKGSQLAIGKVEGEAGCRGYVAVGGGVDVPVYLGSRSTFPRGKLGGLQVGQMAAPPSPPPFHPTPTTLCPLKHSLVAYIPWGQAWRSSGGSHKT